MAGESSSGVLVDFDKLWDFSDPAATETKFRELLPAAESSGDVSYHLQLLTQIARTEGLQRKFDEARATLDQIESQLEETPTVVRVRLLLERGRVFNSSKQTDKAKRLFLDAWETAKEAGEGFFAVDAAHMMAIVESDEESLRWNETAMELAESSCDEQTRGWLGSLYNNIGWTYHDRGEYDRALTLFNKALAFREHEGETGPIRIARWCVARATRSLGQIQEALALQELLLNEHKSDNQKDGFVFEELAECHLALGHSDQSKEFFGLAYAELSQDDWLVDNEPDRIKRLKELGEVADG